MLICLDIHEDQLLFFLITSAYVKIPFDVFDKDQLISV